MSAFTYRAVDPNGRIVRGELAAVSEGELDGRLLQIGLQLITCRPVGRRGAGDAAGAKVSRRELINFCFHLGQAHKAGLPILEALGDLRDSTEQRRVPQRAGLACRLRWRAARACRRPWRRFRRPSTGCSSA